MAFIARGKRHLFHKMKRQDRCFTWFLGKQPSILATARSFKITQHAVLQVDEFDMFVYREWFLHIGWDISQFRCHHQPVEVFKASQKDMLLYDIGSFLL